MALKYAKKGVLAKVEAVAGTNPNPSAAANALQTIGLDPTPIESTVVDLEQDRATLGAAEQVTIGNGAALSFGVYVAGRGDANAGSPIVMPAYDPVIQGVGFKGRAHSFGAWKAAVNYKMGDVVTTGGKAYEALKDHAAADGNKPGAAEFWKEIVAWAAGTEFETGALTFHNNKVYRCHGKNTSANNNSPAAATNGKKYWHEYGPSYIYLPDSDDPKTVWFDANLDGNKHVIKSARGNMTAAFVAGALPQYNFTYQGFYEEPTASVAPKYEYGNYVTPQGVTKRDTPNAAIHGQAVVMNTLNLDLGNQIEVIDEIGTESIELNDRSVSGNAIIEMPKVSSFNWFTRIKDLAKGGLYLQHGKAGNRVEIFAPRVSLAPPSIVENKGRYMLDIPIRFLPRNGDDDIEIRIL